MLGNMLMQTTFDSMAQTPEICVVFMEISSRDQGASIKNLKDLYKELKTKHVEIIDEILKILETL